MGVLHVPQKVSESGKLAIISNQTSFLVFGGMAFQDQRTDKTTYLLTLRHDTKKAQLAKVPQASLPGEGETFRGNVALSLGDNRVAMVGRELILGLDLNLSVTKMVWRELCLTEGVNDQNIPHPD